jgi:hypothetical protein
MRSCAARTPVKGSSRVSKNGSGDDGFDFLAGRMAPAACGAERAQQFFWVLQALTEVVGESEEGRAGAQSFQRAPLLTMINLHPRTGERGGGEVCVFHLQNGLFD